MNLLKSLLAGLSLALCVSAFAASEREALIKQLMQTQGLIELFQSQMQQEVERRKAFAKQALKEATRDLNPSVDFQNRFDMAYANFIERVQKNVTESELVSLWGSYYGKYFSLKELETLLVFYSSNLGQKDLRISKQAVVEMSLYFKNETTPNLERHTKSYLSQLEAIANACNCAK